MVAIIFERELREVAQSINVCLEGRNMAKISVIVPVYNVEPYLRRCINSIINQTFDDFDLVLVDDGSPDRCGEICDEYAEKDTRISVIHQQNSGLSAARNVGIDWSFSESDSDWLTFVDSDDWIHLEYLEILFREAVVHRTNVCICDFQETTGKIGTTDVCMEGIDITPEEFYDTKRINSTIACGKLYKKKCFEKIRYPIGKLHEDEFTTYKILFQFPFVTFINAQLYYYFKNEQSIMHTAWSHKRLVALEAHKEQIHFFMERGFHRAYLRSVRAYVGAICNNCELLEKEKSHYELKKKLKEELRISLKMYRAEVPFNECRWAYVVAYPKFTRFYGSVERLIKGIWRRIHSRN